MKQGFNKDREYLSNMYLPPIVYNSKLYNSSEAIYMLFKNNSKEWQEFFLNNPPNKIKRESRNITLVQDWDNIKIQSMRLALISKFSQHPNLFKKLQQKTELIEWNYWNDKFWGKSIEDGEGLNHLGLLLEEISKLNLYPINILDEF